MEISDVIKILEKHKIKHIFIKRYKNYAYRIKLESGTAIYVHDNGKINYQGKNKDDIKIIIASEINETFNNNVFVVYGHDILAKTELKLLLKQLNLNPLLIDDLPSQGRTIIEQLEHYIKQANYAIVLATPDDEYINNEGVRKTRARQNVIFELGMLCSHLGRNRVSVIVKKNNNFEKPSDIEGIIYLEYKEQVTELKERLVKELKSHNYIFRN